MMAGKQDLMTERHNKIGLVWFRTDLRVVDNTALLAACRQSDNVIALFLSTPMQWHEHDMAPIQVNFIQRRLGVLREQLDSLNIPLLVEEVADFSQVPQTVLELVNRLNIRHVFCNKQYEWNELQCDQSTAQLLKNNQVKFSQFDDACILAPGSVQTKKGEAFKVFTPFRCEWLKTYQIAPPQVQGLPEKLAGKAAGMETSGASKIALTYPKTNSLDWPVDEEAIRQRLVMFCESKAADYHRQRNFPAIDGTSCLSPYLAIGALSPRQCLAGLLAVFPHCLDEPESGAFTWLNEIIWREFYRHLLVAWPKLSRNQPFVDWTRNVRWQESESMLKAWQKGQTGYPIVDAAMRQLRATGWMHNRLRMITASFLTKDLLIHWQFGERWFMSHLIDGDLASNNGGWQWAASTGTDAQPYFRVFNPTTQGEKFDPQGHFIRTWIHELKDVPDKYIHQPHLWPDADILDYPKPVIDHKRARLRAIEVFKLAKEIAGN